MIKLAYKKYAFKVSLKACKSFHTETGLDLQTVFMEYISVCHKTEGMGIAERLVYFSKLYTRDIASKALHSIICEAQDGIDLAEIEDGTFRVSWLPSERDDDLSEPWPMVMLNTALEINDYYSKHITTKKPDTVGSTQET